MCHTGVGIQLPSGVGTQKKKYVSYGCGNSTSFGCGNSTSFGCGNAEEEICVIRVWEFNFLRVWERRRRTMCHTGVGIQLPSRVGTQKKKKKLPEIPDIPVKLEGHARAKLNDQITSNGLIQSQITV